MRFIPAAAAASLLVATVAVPAYAAPPSNDLYSGAVVISEPLPFHATLDTREATTDAADAELAAGCDGIPSTDASVWYQFTPSSDSGYVVDLSASDYPAGGVVASGSPGSWQVESCGPGAFAWFGTAGTTYTIMIIDDQSDGGGNGGTLEMTLDVAPPPPTLDVSVNPSATFNSRTGEALVSGTATCTAAQGAGAFATLEIQLTQRVGRLLIKGYGYNDLECDGVARQWSALVVGDNGLFKGGKAANVTVGYACGAYDCAETFIETTIQLRGGRKG